MPVERIDQVQAAGVIAKIRQTIKAPLVASILKKYKVKEADPAARKVILSQMQKAVPSKVPSRDIMDETKSKLDQEKFDKVFDARMSLQFYINEYGNYQQLYKAKVSIAELRALKTAFGDQAHEYTKAVGEDSVPYKHIQDYFRIARKIMTAIGAANSVACLVKLQKDEEKSFVSANGSMAHAEEAENLEQASANRITTPSEWPAIIEPLPLPDEDFIFWPLEGSALPFLTDEMDNETGSLKDFGDIFYMVIVSANGVKSRCYKLPKQNEQVSIGRHERNTIQIEDGNVSRYHLIVKRIDEKTFCVTDLGSRNGTYLNNVLLKAEEGASWRAGEIIQLGGTALILRQQ